MIKAINVRGTDRGPRKGWEMEVVEEGNGSEELSYVSI